MSRRGFPARPTTNCRARSAGCFAPSPTWTWPGCGRPSPPAPPPGSKSEDPVATGALAATAARTVLRQALLLTGSRLRNRPLRGIRVELDDPGIELHHATAAPQERLVDAVLADTGRPDEPAPEPQPQPQPQPQDPNTA
ncbi:hypothetical protein AB0D87_29845 [Streptomyces sp. NPDC048342]|uniref:hypothetical protein n=1 Tax=unclassified Streptomyces TaxID=2593676 RepID=UPI003429C1AD